jgi:hypothetical protein
MAEVTRLRVRPGSVPSAPAESVSQLQERVIALEEENARLRRFLNDPHRLLQRGLRILSGIGGPLRIY